MAALTRNDEAVYVSSVILLVGYLVALGLIEQTSRTAPSPRSSIRSGLTATSLAVEYWPVAERNTRLVPLAGDLL